MIYNKNYIERNKGIRPIDKVALYLIRPGVIIILHIFV